MNHPTLSYASNAAHHDTDIQTTVVKSRTSSTKASEHVKPLSFSSACSAETHVLVVEDDESMRQMITDYLIDHDIQVTGLNHGRGIDDVLNSSVVDLVILDIKLPGQDGMKIVRRLREHSTIPIIFVTGLNEEADRVMGLELGADDYLTKPFSPRELLARVRALVRRTRIQDSVPQGLARVRGYRFAGWEVSVRLRCAILPNGQKVGLTNSEFNLLAAFLSSPQCVLSRDQLLSMSRLHNDEVYDRAIDVQIGRLRKKLAFDTSTSQIIRTERGLGYVLTVPVDVIR